MRYTSFFYMKNRRMRMTVLQWLMVRTAVKMYYVLKGEKNGN
jgi:hypothetical protein